MTPSHLVRTSIALASLLVTAACGGETLSGGSAEGPPPVTDDAGPGRTTPQPDPGTPTTPVVRDAGAEGLDATPSSPPVVVDAGAGAPIDAAMSAECMSDNDCAIGSVCLWPTSENICEAFNPAGSCTPLGPPCNMVTMVGVGCSCDGTTVTWQWGCNGVPNGYAPDGLAHAGPCADASAPTTPDASAPVSCTSSADCLVGEECGYPIGDCSAIAACLPSQAFSKNCNSATALCGCNGMTVFSGCDAMAAIVPTSSYGLCPSTDAGF